jgi:hypothetical protein
VAGKRKRAAWNVDYLLKILTTPERPTLPTRS